jgi:hypothetical protein
LRLQGFTSPEIAEALALRGVMAVVRDKGFDKAIFASNCLSLIQRLNSLTQDRSQGWIIDQGYQNYGYRLFMAFHL